MTEHEKLVERVARAIENASKHRPYGLYDYSKYPDPNASPPHVVRDERDGRAILRTHDAEEARELFDTLSRQYVGRAALAEVYAALREPTAGMHDGLARDLIMWHDMGTKTPRALFHHLEMLRRPIPDWLRNEPEMLALDHVPSKATRAVLIHRAMTEASPLNPEVK
jgi:hypothetical protein